jgi:hypothetical protein
MAPTDYDLHVRAESTSVGASVAVDTLLSEEGGPLQRESTVAEINWWNVSGQIGCPPCGRRCADGHMSKERTATSGKAHYWLCIWQRLGGFPRLAIRLALRPYKRSISIHGHAFSNRLQRRAIDAAAFRSLICSLAVSRPISL